MTNKKLNLLQKQKLDLQVELNNLVHDSTVDKDKINELKSEILYLDKQIEKIVGKKEIERQNELKNKKSRKDEKNKSDYYNLKFMVKRISPMAIATSRILNIIDKLQQKENINERVKVK